MAHSIVMPSFGMYTGEGVLVSWTKPDGGHVDVGEVLLEIETEKAVQEITAPASGTLHRVLEEGSRLQVETLLGYVLAPGEPVPWPSAAPAPCPVTRRAAPTESRPPGEVPASPLAKRLAREHGVNLGTIVGTGPGGRIVEADVRAVLDEQKR